MVGTACLFHAHAVQDNFILSFVIGRVGKSHAKDITHLVSLWGHEDDSRSCPLNAFGDIDVDRPGVRQVWELWHLSFSPFGDEV
jgi:hypothetical protein